MRRRALLLGLGGLGFGCAHRIAAPANVTPWPVAAAELIPADLDVVVRLDLARMKAVLGAVTADRLAREALSQLGHDGDETAGLVVRSLLCADVAYFAFRPGAELLPLDRVWALQGRFEPVVTSPAGFSGATDLAGDLRYWQRLAGLPSPRRSGVARIYAQGERLRAFVSEAELDAVERALTRPEEPRRLLPAEQGALSLVARPSLVGRVVGGSLGELLAQARRLEFVLDLESDFARFKASLEAAKPDQAARLVQAGRLGLSRALGDLVERAELRAEGERVLFSLRLRREQLAPVIRSFLTSGGEARSRRTPPESD